MGTYIQTNKQTNFDGVGTYIRTNELGGGVRTYERTDLEGGGDVHTNERT